MDFSPGVIPLTKAFRCGRDDPVQALERALAALDRAKDDRAVLARVPTARAEAEAARQRLREGRTLGALDGVPIAVKDSIDVEGLPSTNGTRFLEKPAARDATVVKRLRAAGAVIFAKTNLHELGIQPTGINPHHGTPVNPWDPTRVPGGSSSGGAVAVASGLSPIAVGSDAGGSVRIPAALNGLVGLKPTFGAVPLDGVAGLTLDLDHVGPLAWTVDDATLLFEVLAARRVERNVHPERPALLRELFEGADSEVAVAVRAAAQAAFGVLPEVSAPLSAWAVAVEFVVVATDAQVTCGAYLREHGRQIGADTRMILLLGKALPEADRVRADRVREGMRGQLDELLHTYDVLIGPATGTVAPPLHPAARLHGELDTARIAGLAAQSFVGNLTGLPSVSVPCVREGLPVGLQILGRHGDEARVLSAARAVEREFGPRRPPRWYGS